MKNEYKIFYRYKKHNLSIYMVGKSLQSTLNRFLKKCKKEKSKVQVTSILLIDHSR